MANAIAAKLKLFGFLKLNTIGKLSFTVKLSTSIAWHGLTVNTKTVFQRN